MNTIMNILTSFNEGRNKIDNAVDDDSTAALALSSSSLGWRDLTNAFGASKYSRECLEKSCYLLQMAFELLFLQGKEGKTPKIKTCQPWKLPGRIRTAHFLLRAIFLLISIGLSQRRPFTGISFPPASLHGSLCLNNIPAKRETS